MTTKIETISKKITKAIRIGENKISDICCPDQIVCELKTDRDKEISGCDFKSWQRKEVSDKTEKKRIVLILESPHTKEFKTPIGPAKGKTGKNIGAKLGEVFKEFKKNPLISDTTYDLILMNAIQFQCSMGLPPRFYRTIGFIGIWFDFGMKNFEKRLHDLNLNNNDIVINCCTIGNKSEFMSIFNMSLTQESLRKILKNNDVKYSSSDGLRGLLDNILKEKQSENEFLLRMVNHPSDWDNEILARE